MAVKNPTLKESCREFLAAIIPEDAPEIQTTEMTAAFYAGALTAFDLYRSCGDDSVSEDEGVEIISSIAVELDLWKEEMVARAKDGRGHPKLDDIP